MRGARILYFLSAFQIANGLFDSNLVDFFLDVIKSKNIKFAVIYACFSRYDQIQLAKALNEAEIRHGFATSVVEVDLQPLYFFLDISCENSLKILKTSDSYNYFRSQYKWLIFDSKLNVLSTKLSIRKVLAGSRFRLDSDVLVAVQNGNNTEILLYDIYCTNKNDCTCMRITKFGTWTSSTGIVLICNLSKYEARKNLTGVQLKSGTVNLQPFYNKSLNAHYRSLTHKNTDTINKYNYILFNNLRELFNFTYNMTLTKKWFGNVVGGMDEGLGMLLYENIIDVGATSALMKVDRVPHYDFIFPTYPFRTCFIFRNLKTSGSIDNEFLKPFSSSLWYFVLASIVLFCVVLKFLFCIQHRIFGDNNESWHSALILTWGVICQQGASFIPRSSSGKCALLTMLVMSLLLYNYYTSSIVSSLLSGLPPPISTIAELTQSKLVVGFEDTPYVRTLFEVTKDPILQHFYETKVRLNDEPYMTVMDGLKKVQQGGYSYHTEPPTGYSIIEKTFEPYQICELAEINLFTSTVLFVLFKKHSEYTKLFTIGYNKMLESGIIKREQLIWITRKPACLGSTHLVEVGLDYLLSAFSVFGFGIALTLLLLLGEILVYLYKTQKIPWFKHEDKLH